LYVLKPTEIVAGISISPFRDSVKPATEAVLPEYVYVTP
jgi:hypothetical protein